MLLRNIKDRGVIERALSQTSLNYGLNIIADPSSHSGDAIRQDHAHTFRVKLRAVRSGERGARRSASGRRSVAACWHAHRDFLAHVFFLQPDAIVTTAITRYNGEADFEAVYPRTADYNIGSQARPAYMPDLCDCP